MSDATFAEGREGPLNLGAKTDEDLKVVSALVQDAVFPVTEMRWRASRHQFVVLVNRFRWEDRLTAERHKRGFERVQSLLVIDNVVGVASQGVDRTDKGLVLSLLEMRFEPQDDGAGHLVLTLAGDGALRMSVEALDVTLKDVTRPYIAPSGLAPAHPE